ncbi:pyridoxamine 5'-phosphate oxidase family protein [Anaerocolumna xylanovorans]|uniref:Pyridoxamine 5'-phosphate oxidase n=1 Tax=Anaerocolumna xylanovorans DSM 12503 TaxID=1121345 RepID=A0A1M7Y260_9FIRM|nr:pyridoxamine 5'-phosphate oxidase family protein [Anaerocolumna xylanovorans]SHO45985.1 Pyridoxamine 5'-phosphate oxidase [Anaerocolumna xylanovorans DSM 12503]
MSASEEKIKDYLKSNQRIILATTDQEGSPDVRILGGYGLEGYTVYFSTSKTSNKNTQLSENKNTAVLFQHENQFISRYFNVILYGEAALVENSSEFEKGKGIIQNKNPNVKITKETHNIYKIVPKKLKVLDFGEATTEERVTVFQL